MEYEFPGFALITNDYDYSAGRSRYTLRFPTHEMSLILHLLAQYEAPWNTDVTDIALNIEEPDLGD